VRLFCVCVVLCVGPRSPADCVEIKKLKTLPRLTMVVEPCSLNTDYGFESHLRHRCLCVFILCCSVCRSKESCGRDQETEKATKAHKGCRAMDT
jgi:hypothetical protein